MSNTFLLMSMLCTSLVSFMKGRVRKYPSSIKTARAMATDPTVLPMLKLTTLSLPMRNKVLGMIMENNTVFCGSKALGTVISIWMASPSSL